MFLVNFIFLFLSSFVQVHLGTNWVDLDTKLNKSPNENWLSFVMESQDLQLSNETESSFHFHLKAELENEEEELEDHFSEKAPAFLEIFSFHNSDIASIGTKSYTSNKYNFHAEIPLRILHQVFLI